MKFQKNFPNIEPKNAYNALNHRINNKLGNPLKFILNPTFYIQLFNTNTDELCETISTLRRKVIPHKMLAKTELDERKKENLPNENCKFQINGKYLKVCVGESCHWPNSGQFYHENVV